MVRHPLPSGFRFCLHRQHGQPAYRDKPRRVSVSADRATDCGHGGLAALAGSQGQTSQHEAAGTFLAGHRLDRLGQALGAVASAVAQCVIFLGHRIRRFSHRAQTGRRIRQRRHCRSCLSGRPRRLPSRARFSHQRSGDVLAVPPLRSAPYGRQSVPDQLAPKPAVRPVDRYRSALQVVRHGAAGAGRTCLVDLERAGSAARCMVPRRCAEACDDRRDCSRRFRHLVPHGPAARVYLG